MHLYQRLELKLKKYCALQLNQSQWIKQYVEFNKQKKTRAEKNGDKDRKALSKLLSNAVYSEIMENVKKKNGFQTRKQQKILFKMDIKMKHYVTNFFQNDIVAITLNKPAYVGMSNSDLMKVLMYEFCYDYIEN